MDEKIDTFTVTVLGWEKHNSGKKKGHEYFLLSARFFDDHKIQALTQQERLCYLWILARCASETRATIVATVKQMRSQVGASTVRGLSELKSLERNQLLTIDKTTPLYNIKERR